MGVMPARTMLSHHTRIPSQLGHRSNPMTYTYGQTKTPLQRRIEAQNRIRQEAAELSELEAQLKAHLEATRNQLAALPTAKYQPTEEALAWRDRPNKPILPEPKYGGPSGLRAAAREASTWDTTHRRGTWNKEGQRAA